MRVDESRRRIGEVRRRLPDLQLHGLVVTSPENVRYLSGFSGSLGYLLIGEEVAEIVGDSRYWIQMEDEAPAFTLVRTGASQAGWSVVAQRLQAHGWQRVGFESEHVTVDQYDRLRREVPETLELVPTRGLIDEIRMIKTPEEIDLLRTVARIAGRAFDRVREAVHPGMRERDVAFLLEQSFRELGADGPSFETIVAAGERGALPHGRASDRVIESGDLVVVDFGARAAGYNSDTTRTIVVGQPSPEQLRVIDAVRRAQQESMSLMRSGAKASDVDQRARQVMEGEEHAFRHGLGHGIGLMVHERPYLSASDETVLQPGMVVTNEPGLYIPGWGGVRLEEMVLITDHGPEVISPASTQVAAG